MSKEFQQPRKLPQSMAQAHTLPTEVDPSAIVLDMLDAIAGAMDMQATIAAANFILHNPHDLPDGVLKEVTSAASAAALAYLRDVGQNGGIEPSA